MKTSITATQLTALRLVEGFAGIKFSCFDFRQEEFFVSVTQNGLDHLVPCKTPKPGQEPNRLVIYVVGRSTGDERFKYAVHFIGSREKGFTPQLVRIASPSDRYPDITE